VSGKSAAHAPLTRTGHQSPHTYPVILAANSGSKAEQAALALAGVLVKCGTRNAESKMRNQKLWKMEMMGKMWNAENVNRPM